mgnify:CR=1 FL=1
MHKILHAAVRLGVPVVVGHHYFIGVVLEFRDSGERRAKNNAAKATCSVPMLCEPVEIDGHHYLDGSIADSIPIEHALECGCDKLVIESCSCTVIISAVRLFWRET